MSKRRNILRTRIQVQEKLEACRNSESDFSSRCFIADDSHLKAVWLHAEVFIGHDILHF